MSHYLAEFDGIIVLEFVVIEEKIIGQIIAKQYNIELLVVRITYATTAAKPDVLLV